MCDQKNIFLIVLLLIFFLMLPEFSGAQAAGSPPAQKGRLDLSSHDFNADGIVELNGEWEFYWQHLISPTDFASGTAPSPTGFMALPGCWNHYKIEGSPITGNGFATFRLKVRPPTGDTLMGVRILNQATAYRLWINGKMIAGNGVLGKDAATSIPQLRLQVKYFKPRQPELEFVLQVSNFHHKKGGVWSPIYFGPADRIQQRHCLQWIFDLMLFGGLLIMGIYHLGLFSLRKEDMSSFYFALFTLIFAVRVLVSGDYYLTLVFPSIPYWFVYKLELISVMIAPPALLLFISSIFRQKKQPWPVYGFLGAGVLFSLLTLVVSARTASYFAIPNQFFILMNICYTLLILISALAKKEKGSFIVLAGIVILGLAILNDILNANQVIHTIDLTPFGVFCLIFSQSYVLSSRFAGAFHGIRQLSDELEQKNIALKRMDKIKNEFLANTSHELRTPLNGIIGLAESIRNGVFGKVSDNIENNLELIALSGRRLSSLINDILDFSRLKNRDIRLYRVPVDMRALVDTVLTVSGQSANGKHLTLANRIPKDLPRACGDELRIQQILYNLVGNAVKFTRKGEVAVTGAVENNRVKITVSDTGIGIPTKDQERIFESFEQGEGSGSRPFEGVGLGLAITRNLVALHKGEISISSAPGKGSSFSFTLPVSSQPSSNAPVSPPEVTPPFIPKDISLLPVPDRFFDNDSAENSTILAVDDDPVNLQVVANQLSLMDGVRVVTRPNGLDAMSWIHENGPPDLLLLDIMMPGMTGYEVCRTLRQTHPAHELPIIMLTAKSQLSDLVEGFACGANDYLSKPFSGEELLARVNTHLDLKKAYTALEENIRLKEDIRQRKQTELNLRMTQTRLSRILDTLDDVIIAVNENREIAFCNFSCENLLGHPAGHLLGQPASSLFPAEYREKADQLIERMTSTDALSFPAGDLETDMELCGNPGRVHCRIQSAFLDLDHERLWIMVLQDIRNGARGMAEKRSQISPILLINELNETLERIQGLEDFFQWPEIPAQAPEFKKSLSQLRQMLEQAEKSLPGPDERKEKKTLGVEAMNLALECWEQATGQTKPDLARASGIWTVYMNKDGFERTQTLDKYLDIEKFPKRPRWNKIFQTLDFVLLSCETDFKLKSELEDLFSKLQQTK